MKSILFTYRFEDEGSNEKTMLLESMGYKVYYEKESTFEFKPYMKDVEALICYTPFKKLNIDDFPSLKWIQLTSMGFEQVPAQQVAQRQITVTNYRGGYKIPMGEWVVLNILELIKKRKSAYGNQTNKIWFQDFSVGELYNKTITFVGTGDIAQESTKRLKGFGVKILGINTNGRSIDGFDQCFPMTQLDLAIAQSHVVVICLPHTPETKHLFNKERLEKMKTDACLINVSRGAVIKEEDLIKHLEEGKLKGVALDVFEQEPLPKENKLWDFDRVVITSHNSWVSEMRDQRRWELMYENLKRYKNQEELLNVVKMDKGY